MVKVESTVDFMGYKVVRIRPGDPTQVLTAKGWIEKKPVEQLTFDETMIWSGEELQELVTELQKLDIKPKDASYTEGKLEATNQHLEDMRNLVFGKKKKLIKGETNAPTSKR